MGTKRLVRNSHKLMNCYKLFCTKRHQKQQRGKVRKSNILKSMLKDKDFIKCLSDCSCNILKGNVVLTKKQKMSLRKKKTPLRKLASAKTSMKSKKNIVQKGGFLSVLLPPIISVLGGLLGDKLFPSTS